VSHFGDFGQAELRPEQRKAIGDLDALLLPVGAGPTVGGESAAAIVRALRPRLVIPMHYRTEAVNFLDPPDEFLAALGAASSASTRASSKPSNSSARPRIRPSHCSRRLRSSPSPR
jgi:L-ascorbate metabolism protein UlaG (beta-lactamase superfamily)